MSKRLSQSQYDIWCRTFKPEVNKVVETEQFDGCMLETFGPEIEYVLATLKAQPNRVWTVVEGDSGKWYISQGYHLVNRVGYLVTEVEFDPADPAQCKRFLHKDTFYL